MNEVTPFTDGEAAMFLRMVTHIIRAEDSEKNARTYAGSVLSGLRTTDGCVFAALLQESSNPQRCISLTIWSARDASVAYEESGLYQKLVDSLRPYFLETDEWKLELSEDLSLQYTPVRVEPSVEGFDETLVASGSLAGLKRNPFAVHILAVSVLEEHVGNFEKILASEIYNRYRHIKGFLELVTVRQQRTFFVISFWDETVDLQSSSGVHSLDRLGESVSAMLPSFIQWKATHKHEAQLSASSEDVKASVYRCLTAEWFAR